MSGRRGREGGRGGLEFEGELVVDVGEEVRERAFGLRDLQVVFAGVLLVREVEGPEPRGARLEG